MKSRIVVSSVMFLAALACSVAFADTVRTVPPANGADGGAGLSPSIQVASLDEASARTELKSKLSLLQVPFIKNEAQIKDDRVKYFARILNGSVFIEDDKITYAISHEKNGKRKTWAVKETFVGAGSTKAEGLVASKTRVSFFKGSEAAEWKSNLPTYEVVGLGEVYDHVELHLKAYNSNMEKVFIVKEGGSPASIAARVDGVKRLSVDKTGALELVTKAGKLTMTPPVAYQEIDGKKSMVEVSYRLMGKNTYGFKVAAYDKTRPLVIDPLLASTFLGSTSVDYGYAIAVDASGSIFVTGYTNSQYFPTVSGAYAEDWTAGYDVFVSQLSNDLTALQASTFLGGYYDDYGYAIALDGSGNVYVAGTTKSTDFPISSTAYAKKPMGNLEIFITKFDSTLSTLLASTYFGGASPDQVNAILLDSVGSSVYITGSTQSKDFPIILQTGYNVYYHGGGDAFISSLATDLSTLKASTFLGGAATDQITAFGQESVSRCLYVVGSTKSPDFPTTAYATRRIYGGGASDAFVTRINVGLTDVEGSTFLGGSGDDIANAVVVDSAGVVYVAGYTASSNFPTSKLAKYRKSAGKEDGFVTKLTWDAVSTPPRLKLEASTFIGGTSSDYLRAVALDTSGNVFVAGSTKSKDYPVLSTSYQAYKKGEDAVISEFDVDLTQLLGSTFVGGSSDERIHGMVLDSSGTIYAVGATKSSDYPVSAAAYDIIYGGLSKEDAFISTFTTLDK